MSLAMANPEIAAAPIDIRGLFKEYGHGDGVHGLDLSIPEGCSFGLLGPNGAGKSTTIKVLMGLTPPTSGEVRVLGHDVRSDAHAIRLRVGYVPERHHIYPWMTIAEVIWFTQSFYPYWDDALCQSMLKDYGLDPRKKVKQLSHGMTTKLALILALCHDPDLLILDEPTTGLDPLIREEFLEGINRLIRIRPRTVLFSSHIMSDIEKVADTIGIINEGRLLVCAGRDKLMEKTIRLKVTLKPGNSAPERPREAILSDTDGRCWDLTVYDLPEGEMERLRRDPRVERVDVQSLDLEEVFKDFIKGARRTI
ncbi:MAG: ABC transporter ATP-binding protein [Candidatus Hydrogenedentes bacterium]|nr:ABC transporter ATP-binding protein [Candidatus Hydrogenedentota bacterium]